jgi:uncharacterized protein (DUF302 family)
MVKTARATIIIRVSLAFAFSMTLALLVGSVVSGQRSGAERWVSVADAGGQDGKPMNENGLITIGSRNSVKVTVDRLEADLKAKGVTVFALIDHAAGTASAGMPLRPTELLIFGNPKAGTPLMQASQTIGIDLPLKVLVWEDPSGGVWISYNDPAWLAQRHKLGNSAEAAVKAMAGMLAKLAEAAAG